MIGPCAKARVYCTLVTPEGERIHGENLCANAQEKCPRAPGEDYTKCTTICQQMGHAEVVAIKFAGPKARGARAYVKGHTYACRACQEALWAAGVKSVSVGEPE